MKRPQWMRRKPKDYNRPVKLWPFPLALATVIVTGVAVFSGAFYVLWYSLHLQIGLVWDAKTTLDVVRIALIVAGGLGGVVALVVAYRKQRNAEDDSRRENTKLFNERFTTASAQLGHDAAAVRLAGVYAIAGLADDWLAGRQTCIDVLCAYSRMPYQPKPTEDDWSKGEREVRLSIISIIRDHLRMDPTDDLRSWRGHDLDFTGATFDGGDFTGAHFVAGTVRFEGATFSGGTVMFDGATFSGSKVRFNGATFSGGTVRFNGATFSGGTVRFDAATFSQSMVWFNAATFSGGAVGFPLATFSGGTVGFHEAKFSGGMILFDLAKFSGGKVLFALAEFSSGAVSFNAATFSSGDVEFDLAKFSGSVVGFHKTTFSGSTVEFSGATFSSGDVEFDLAKFSGGEVGFLDAKFSGGRVDLSHVREYSAPPTFSDFTTPPPGLLRPPAKRQRGKGDSSVPADASTGDEL